MDMALSSEFQYSMNAIEAVTIPKKVQAMLCISVFFMMIQPDYLFISALRPRLTMFEIPKIMKNSPLIVDKMICIVSDTSDMPFIILYMMKKLI